MNEAREYKRTGAMEIIPSAAKDLVRLDFDTGLCPWQLFANTCAVPEVDVQALDRYVLTGGYSLRIGAGAAGGMTQATLTGPRTAATRVRWQARFRPDAAMIDADLLDLQFAFILDQPGIVQSAWRLYSNYGADEVVQYRDAAAVWQTLPAVPWATFDTDRWHLWTVDLDVENQILERMELDDTVVQIGAPMQTAAATNTNSWLLSARLEVANTGDQNRVYINDHSMTEMDSA